MQEQATTTRCTECHRPLRSATSIARGRGRTCDRKTRQAAAATNLTREFKNPEAAKAKALQLLADNALIPTRHAGQYLATSTDGTTAYLVDTTERTCTCKGHTHVGRCYHLVAADTRELCSGGRRGFVLAA